MGLCGFLGDLPCWMPRGAVIGGKGTGCDWAPCFSYRLKDFTRAVHRIIDNSSTKGVNNVCGDLISFRRWEKHGAQSQPASFPPITAPRGIQ